MKPVRRFSSSTEAQLAAHFLDSHGIEAEVRGSRLYSTHILGGDVGEFDLLVDDADYEKSLSVLGEVTSEPVSPTEITASSYLRKSMNSAIFGALILPVVFNIVSLVHLMKYRENEADSKKRNFMSVLIVLLQLPVAYTGFVVLSKLFQILKSSF